MADLNREAPRHKAIVRVLLAVAAAWTWHVHFWPTFHAACESQSLYFVQAIVEDGRADLGGSLARHGNIPVGCAHHRGREYIAESPGLALSILPLYASARLIHPGFERRDLWLFGYLACLLCVTLPLLVALWGLWRYMLGIGVRHAHAAWAVLALALCSPLFVYATLLFSSGLAAACVAIAFWLVGGQDSTRPRRLLAAGAVLGFGGVVDMPVFMLAPLFALYAGLRPTLPHGGDTRRQRVLAAGLLLAGALPWALGQLAYDAWLFDHPLRLAATLRAWPAATSGRGASVSPPSYLDDLADQWLGERSGVLYHAPWLALAAIGTVLAALRPNQARERRIDAAFLILAPASYALMIASFSHWRLSDSIGVRDLVPVLPLLSIGLAHFLHARTWPALVLACAATTVLVGFLMAMPIVATFPYHFHQLKQPVIEFSWPLVILGHFSPTPGRWLGWSDWVSLGAFVLLCGLPWLLVGWPSTPEDPHRSKRWLRILAVAALSLAWTTSLMASTGRNNRAREVAKYNASQFLGPSAALRDARMRRARH